MLHRNRLLYLDAQLYDYITGPIGGGGTDGGLVRWNGTDHLALQDCTNCICDDNGQISIGGSSASGMLDITQRAAAVTGLEINGAANRSAPLLQLIEGSGTPTGDLIQIASPKFVIDKDGKVGIGVVPIAQLQVETTDYPVIRGTRTTSITSDGRVGMSAHHKTSGNMTDGFGAGFSFDIEDNAGVINPIAAIYGDRDGADNSGRLRFQVLVAGSPRNRMVIDNLGNIGINELLPITVLEITHASPYISLHNSSKEDTDGGRECRIIARGEQSGGEETMLGFQEFAHDGSSDDEKGYHRICLNDGNDGESPTERLRILSNGDVGIGTTTPGAKLDILSSGTVTGLILGGDSTGATRTDNTPKVARIGVPHYDTDEEDMAIISAASGSVYGIVSIGGSSVQNTTTQIQFRTASNISTLGGTIRMVINSDGNVGIGTTAPDKMLEINKATGGEIRLTYNDADGSATNYCDFVTDANGGLTVTTVDSDGAAGHINFNPDGNIGIGDPSPGEKLDVAGNANVTGVYKVDDIQIIGNQQAHIVDADGTLADITTKFNTLLSYLDADAGHGLLAGA